MTVRPAARSVVASRQAKARGKGSVGWVQAGQQTRQQACRGAWARANIGRC